MNKFIKRAIMGFVYGNFYPVSAYLAQHTNSTLAAVIIQYFVTAVIGMTFACTTLIFEIDKWSITAQTALHFVITSVVMYISGFLCGWFPHNTGSTVIWFAIFIVIYVIMWVSFTLYFRKQTKKINEAL